MTDDTNGGKVLPERLSYRQKNTQISIVQFIHNILANQSEEREPVKTDMRIMIWASTVIVITDLVIDFNDYFP